MNFRLLFILASFVGIAFLVSFTRASNQDPWPVPDKYVKMSNPVKADPASLTTAKPLWIKHCQSCHGKQGAGDGPKAAQLKTPAGDFTKADFHKQTDGSIFYKTVEGRDDMPGFKKKLPDEEEIWSLVNYIRTLKK